MKPLIVLLVSFAFTLFFRTVIMHKSDVAFCARVAMSVMLIFTAIAHFVFTKGMVMMIPDFLPFKQEIVYLTGIIEIAAAIGLHIHGYILLTGVLLILFRRNCF